MTNYQAFHEEFGYLPDKYDIAFERAMRDNCDSYTDDVLSSCGTLAYMFWNNPSPALEIILNNILEKWAFEQAQLDNYQKYI